MPTYAIKLSAKRQENDKHKMHDNVYLRGRETEKIMSVFKVIFQF